MNMSAPGVNHREQLWSEMNRWVPLDSGGARETVQRGRVIRKLSFKILGGKISLKEDSPLPPKKSTETKNLFLQCNELNAYDLKV